MTRRTAANRYARALFDVALKERQDLAAIDRELAEFIDLLAQHAAFGKVLLNPAVPAARKRAAVASVISHAKLSPAVAKLLVLLAERDRMILLADLLEAFRERVRDFQKIVVGSQGEFDRLMKEPALGEAVVEESNGNEEVSDGSGKSRDKGKPKAKAK